MNIKCEVEMQEKKGSVVIKQEPGRGMIKLEPGTVKQEVAHLYSKISTLQKGWNTVQSVQCSVQGEGELQCRMCPEVFTSRLALDIHIGQRHTTNTGLQFFTLVYCTSLNSL